MNVTPAHKNLLAGLAAALAAGAAAYALGVAAAPRLLAPGAALAFGAAVAQAAPYLTLGAAVLGAAVLVAALRRGLPRPAGAVAAAAVLGLTVAAGLNVARFREIDRQDEFRLRRVPARESLAHFIARSPDRYSGIAALAEFRRRAPGAVLHIDRKDAERAYVPVHRMAGVGGVRVELDGRPVTAAVDATWTRVSFVPFVPLYLDPAAMKPHAELCGAMGGEALIVTNCPTERP